VIPALLEALKDNNGDVRLRAAYALGNIGDRSVLEALTYVAENDPYRYARDCAKDSINRIRSKTLKIKKKK
jgi:HEAT repeat protein